MNTEPDIPENLTNTGPVAYHLSGVSVGAKVDHGSGGVLVLILKISLTAN